MPYIKSKIESEKIVFADVDTLVLDIDKTKELTLNDEKTIMSLSLKDIEELRNKYVSNEIFKKILDSADEKWKKIKQNIDSVDVFYDVVWNRTHLELMFLTRYYTQELVNPLSFELLVKNKTKFDYWWNDNIKHVFLAKLKNFYIKCVEVYAEVAPVDIFEKDVAIKAKEVIENIEDGYINDVKEHLKYEWEKALEYYNKVFKKSQELKRKSILFE